MINIVKKYCTKERPFVPTEGIKENESWEHIDVYEVDPEYEGEILLFHCPNCGEDISVDCRFLYHDP